MWTVGGGGFPPSESNALDRADDTCMEAGAWRSWLRLLLLR
nr:hypothetical protein RSP673_19560 [Ralstonia solanacearum P673]